MHLLIAPVDSLDTMGSGSKSKRRSSKIFSRLRRFSNGSASPQTGEPQGGEEEPQQPPPLPRTATKKKRSRLSLLSRSSNSSAKSRQSRQSDGESEHASTTNRSEVMLSNSSIEDIQSSKASASVETAGTKEQVVTTTTTTIYDTTTTTSATHAEEYSPLSPKYLSQASRSRTHHYHSPSHNSQVKPIYHSYDHRFSTTALAQLNMHSANSSRGSTPPGKSRSYGNLVFDDPLLYRTGSRVWEEVKESKGQVWLDTRQTSTQFDGRGDNGESDDEGILQIGFKPLPNRRRSSVENDPIDSMRENDDSWYSERIFIGNERETDDDEVDNDQDILVKSKFISFIDWALGLEQDSISPTVQKQLSKERRQLTKEEKIKQRDQDQPLDVAWYLGLFSNLF